MHHHTQCPACQSEKLTGYLSTTDYALTQESFDLLRCTICGLLLTKPIPTDLTKYYHSDTYISHVVKKANLFQLIYAQARRHNIRHKAKLVRTTLRTRQQISILDIGCGIGSFLSYCQNHFGWTTTGTEPATQARNVAIQQNLNVLPRWEDLTDQPSFNAITLWHVLEHIPQLETAIQKIHRILNQEGFLFLALPNYNSYDSKYYKHYWAGYDVPRHLWHFNPDTIQLMANKNGFKLVEILPMKLDSYYVSLLSENYRNALPPMIKQLHALYIGLTSNLKATKTRQYSSLLYILQK